MGIPLSKMGFCKRSRLDVKFLMTQGDPALAGSSPRHIGTLPTNKEDLFKYDLIILGDVPSGYFSNEQIELMDELVKEEEDL